MDPKKLVVLTEAQVLEIVQDLRGTTGNLDLAIEAVAGVDRGSVDDKCLAFVDEYIFLCEVCGWWCDRDEEDENTPDTCKECASDYADEDDADGYECCYDQPSEEQDEEE